MDYSLLALKKGIEENLFKKPPLILFFQMSKKSVMPAGKGDPVPGT
jgi:hypothetical protein